MENRKNYVKARLFTGSGDWYVYYKSYDPARDRLVMKKDYQELNVPAMSDKKRIALGKAKVDVINARLLSGWSPFPDLNVSEYADDQIKAVLDKLFEIKKPTIRPRTIQHYKHALDLFKAFLPYDIKPEAFTKLQAQGFSDWLVSTKGHSGKTHNNTLLSINAFFNMMVEREIIAKNPFKGIKRKPVQTGKNLAYTDKQRKEIREYLERNKHPLYPLVQFIYYCFIRPNELMQLQIKHIDFSTSSISIPSHISKNRNQSSVEMPKAFAQLCKNRYGNLDPELYICGRGLVPHPIPVHRNRISHAHKLVLQDLKISNDHTLYSHKHTGAVAAAKAGVSPYDLMRQLRHSSLEQTMVYLASLGLTPNTGYSQKQTTF